MLVGHIERNFDIDLSYGKEGEELVLSLLNGGKKVEVKTDRIAHKTGNIAVEFRFKGYPSGISTSEADYWAFVLADYKLIKFIRTDILRNLAREHYKLGHVKRGGDGNQSEMILIPLKNLTNEIISSLFR